MAAIDKTYGTSYKEYIEFQDWANSQVHRFFDGHTEHIGNYVQDYDEHDFYYGCVVMNTPRWLDAYLIQNCKSDFVLDRMREVYSEETYAKLEKADLKGTPPSDFKLNRNIVIKATETTQYRLDWRYSSSKVWALQCEAFDYWYNNRTNRWSSKDLFYPTNTNTAHFKSVKKVIKHLQSQYLPKGIEFRLHGRYRGEEYLIRVL